MPAKRKPRLDQVFDGVRVRVYGTRSEWEVIFDDDDIGNPDANVLVYPKRLNVLVAARQGLLERG